MKTGTSQEQFEKSGEIHDSINAEAHEISSKYATPPTPPAEPRKPYNPLTEEAVNEKSYAKPNIKITPLEANQPIPEPTMVAPPQSTAPKDGAAAGPTAPPKPINPKMQELNPKEKTNAAKTAAAMAINGYEALHLLGNHVVKISDNKLKKLARKNLIDLRMPIRVGDNQIVTLQEYVEAYNEQTGDVFTVTTEFKEEVTPVLERVLEKKGIGATDEQMLIYLVSKDLVVKGVQCVALLKQKKDALNQLVDLTEAYRANTAAHGRPTQQAHQATPPPQQQAAPSNDKPPYTPPPTPPAFEEEVEVAEIIPNEIVFEGSSPIPEPLQPEHVDITEFQEEVKQRSGRKPKQHSDDVVKKARRKNKID